MSIVSFWSVSPWKCKNKKNVSVPKIGLKKARTIAIWFELDFFILCVLTFPVFLTVLFKWKNVLFLFGFFSPIQLDMSVISPGEVGFDGHKFNLSVTTTAETVIVSLRDKYIEIDLFKTDLINKKVITFFTKQYSWLKKS